MKSRPLAWPLTGLLLLLGAGPLAAVPLWSVEGSGTPGTVLLLGSVHVLRDVDQPLPAVVHHVYRQADRLVMELDPQELHAPAFQASLDRVGIMTPGRTTREMLGAEQWREADQLARAAGLELAPVAALEPWFASLALYSGALAAAGYDPALGVDQQLADWAQRDGKPATGLETLDQQLLLFKTLDDAVQVETLLKTLEDLATVARDAAALTGHWRDGDIEQLAQRLEADFEGYEALRARIVGDRNRAWLPQLEALLQQDGVSLVVVGALHLVGPEGLPSLLESRGLSVSPAMNHGSLERRDAAMAENSDLDHLEIFLAGTAVGAAPAQGHVVPFRARVDTPLGIALGFFIDVPANHAHISFHR
jgi:uncharacterized protein YbaP (TraB family)